MLEGRRFEKIHRLKGSGFAAGEFRDARKGSCCA